MEEWDAQKMLDLYIHDYLVRKNLHNVADTLAQEANIQPKSVVINPPEGFLSEWWSMFWDVYCSRAGINPSAEQASTSTPPQLLQAPQTSASVPQNAQPVSPVTDGNYMLQNICPTMAPPGLPNLLQAAGYPMAVPTPEMGSLLSVVPPRILDPTLNIAHDAEQFDRMQPSGSTSGSRRKRVNNRRQSPLSQGINLGTDLRRPTTSELAPPAPKLILDSAVEQTDAGRKMWNLISSEDYSLTGLRYNIPVPKIQKQVPAAFGKLVISEPSTSKMASPTPLDDGSKGKSLQIEKNTENEKLYTDEDVGYFLSTEENPENMNMHMTLPNSHRRREQQEFPLRIVRSLHPSDNKLSCCDFSSQGRYLAAAGHEKKVIIWNLSISSRESLQGHTQLITDVRFKPDSTMLATSSFDKTVKIWDASYSSRMLCNLVGHEDQVMSVDFHPKSSNLLCSCDTNDIIRIWNLKDSTCFGFYKGGNRQVRFQPRHGNLLAAATGNSINLINIETGVTEQRFEGHEKDIRSLCWDVCGDYLVSASEDSTRIWSLLSAGKSIHHLNLAGTDFTSCTFHPAYSQVVAIGSYQSIYIWNPTMGSKTWAFPAHQGIISAMANAPETNTMASVSHDQWIKLWR